MRTCSSPSVSACKHIDAEAAVMSCSCPGGRDARTRSLTITDYAARTSDTNKCKSDCICVRAHARTSCTIMNHLLTRLRHSRRWQGIHIGDVRYWYAHHNTANRLYTTSFRVSVPYYTDGTYTPDWAYKHTAFHTNMIKYVYEMMISGLCDVVCVEIAELDTYKWKSFFCVCSLLNFNSLWFVW